MLHLQKKVVGTGRRKGSDALFVRIIYLHLGEEEKGKKKKISHSCSLKSHGAATVSYKRRFAPTLGGKHQSVVLSSRTLILFFFIPISEEEESI